MNNIKNSPSYVQQELNPPPYCPFWRSQSLTVLLSSFAVGASLGTIICVLILTAHPVITGFTFLAISGWLLAVFAWLCSW